MALIVEDGSNVANANSYVTLVEARAYATARGVTLSATDSVVEALVMKAMDYLESLRADYKGIKANETQALQWPRTGVSIDGYDIASNTIPTLLKNAEMQLVMDINSGLDPMASSDGGSFVVSEKVGPIETKYSEAVSTSGMPILRRTEALIAPLLNRQGLLTVERA